MMFSPRIMPRSLLVYALLGICISGCVKMNVISQGEEKKDGPGTSEGIDGFGKVVELVIDVHTAAIIPPISPVEVTTIFNHAGEIVQRSNGLGDVECPVKFTLKNGMVGTFNDAPQEIWGIDDLQKLNDKYKGVKVVRAILWCDKDEFWPGISGCTLPGKGVVVVREDPSLEPVLAAHEANHVFGGVHRNESNAVMNEWIESTNKLLNRSECDLYR